MIKFLKLRFTANVLSLFKCITALQIQKNSKYSYQTLSMGSRIENDGSTIIIHPADGSHSASVILMHGLGDSAEGWIDAAESMSKSMVIILVLHFFGHIITFLYIKSY